MRLKNCSFIFVFLFFFTLLCCAPPQKEDVDVAQVRKAIDEANLKYSEAIRQGGASAVAELYTEDAVLLNPGQDMIQGKQDIKEYYSSVLQRGGRDKVLSTLDFYPSGDIAYEIGLVGASHDALNIKYVVIWKRTADGSWKIHVDIWNRNYTTPKKKS